MNLSTRREFLRSTVAALAGVSLGRSELRADDSVRSDGAFKLPPRHGFNLLEKFRSERQHPFVERDFEWIARWHLDFVRLPMDYRCWTDENDSRSLDDKVLREIDQVVSWGKEYDVHVNLNLHRAPGYCVNPPAEKLDLWTSEKAQEDFCFQWRQFADRYRDIPSSRLSFDLVNEPKDMAESLYTPVMKQAIRAIREVTPDRLIVVDGLRWGRNPVLSLVEERVAQSTRGYDPMEISHYKASWVGSSKNWREPTWPLGEGERRWDRERYQTERIRPWKQLEERGVGVHVGEWGCYNKTPHKVALAWMRDLMSLWREAGWGWALWNLRGAFGVVDSGRKDVPYERFDGHDLDRRMLELLLEA